MNNESSSFVYGKIPAKREFVAINLPSGLEQILEGWFSDLLPANESEEASWAALNWNFAIGKGQFPCGVMGVLRASYDALGRRYPLMVGARFDAETVFDHAHQAEVTGWYERAVQLCGATVDHALPEEQLEIHLTRLPKVEGADRTSEMAALQKVVEEWHAGGGVGQRLPLSSVERPLSVLGAGIARLGMARLCEGYSLWWKKALLSEGSELLHVRDIPSRHDLFF